MESVLAKGARKIRACPKNPEMLHEPVRQQRRACSLAIACFIEADRGLVDPKGQDLKRTALRSADCDEAASTAFRTRDAVIRRRKEGDGCGFSFRGIRDMRQRIAVRKPSGAFVARNLDLAEPMPDEAWKKLTTMVLERGQWFICAQLHIVTVGQDEIQVRSIMSLDPGVRTFVTACSVDHAASHGDGFHADRVFPLLLKLDRPAGQRAKARHGEWKRHFRKRIDRLAVRVRSLVDDLHRRVTRDLGRAFDVILLPSFETGDMSAREGRKIRTRTVRSMLGLAHCRFQRRLAWMCRKCGKRLIVANEACTGRTRSRDGFANPRLGGARTVSDGTLFVDRDMSGARGVMLRAHCRSPGRFRAAGADVALGAE